MEEPKIRTLDQLLHQRSVDIDQTPLLAFSKTRQGVTDYEPISGYTLNKFIDGAAEVLKERGFPSVEQDTVVSLAAPTDLDYLVTIFGLIRLGYTPFQISNRLAPSIVRTLVKDQNSRTLFYSPDNRSFKVRDPAFQDLDLHPLVTREEYDQPSRPKLHNGQQLGNRRGDMEPNSRRCMILHSSGSSGLVPKTIDMEHHRMMLVATYSQKALMFTSAPFSHAFGLSSFMQALHSRSTIYWLDGYTPQTPDNLTAALQAVKPETVFLVPYVLGLLAEKPEGMEALKMCRAVRSGGSRLPDNLGDMLTQAGVHLGMSFGSTETGLTLSSAYRPREDKAWDYLRPPPHVRPYIRFRPSEDGKYEAIILDGHKGKTMSNSDDPPRSWHTGDLFIPHSTIPDAWKFVGRKDDRITLVNGEKLIPLATEGLTRQHPLVKEAVMFGVDRPVPGLLLFKAMGTSHLTDEQFIEKVWPAIEESNNQIEGFSQISREMIAVLPEHIECPSTEKGSIKRAQIYRDFASVIDSVYEEPTTNGHDESLKLTVPELESWILDKCQSLGCDVPDTETNFFAAGIDSLKAVHLRSIIQKHIDLGGRQYQCTTMIIFDCGNTKTLAQKLFEIRTGTISDGSGRVRNSIEEMQRMIARYSITKDILPATLPIPKPRVVVLTGATGFLGAHILSALVSSSSVSKVYCFVRTAHGGSQSAESRLATSLRAKEFDIPMAKVVPLSANLVEDNFGLDVLTCETIQMETSDIIHCAWLVNFAMPLSAFEPQVAGLHRLIRLSLQTKHHSRFFFCSSVSVGLSVKGSPDIASSPMPSLEDAAPTGYAQSKLVCERILQAASAAGADTTILRIGQIVPGLSRGTKLWNPSEAVPLMVQSSNKNSAGSLPILGPGRDVCSWLQADTLADAIVDIAGLSHPVTEDSICENGEQNKQQLVYNLVNPRVFSWKDEFVPALKQAGLEFDLVPWAKWLQRLETSSQDAAANPSRKLVDFWAGQPDRQDQLAFDVSDALHQSPALQAASTAVEGDYVKKLVQAWRDIDYLK